MRRFPTQIEKLYLRTSARHEFQSSVHNPQGVALHGDKLYYVDRDYETLVETDKAGTNSRVMRRNMRSLSQLRVYEDRHNKGDSEKTLCVMGVYCICCISASLTTQILIFVMIFRHFNVKIQSENDHKHIMIILQVKVKELLVIC